MAISAQNQKGASKEVTDKESKGSRKSGIRSYKPGDILFKEKEMADSLYIIQKGQVRLYVTKGNGFVDIAILRPGEVIGEMAYFDERARRRSCSAAAIVSTDVIEISFHAFNKAIDGLNPWFKTIINTLADRLRKTNDKVKALESSSLGPASYDKPAVYIFLHNIDVVRILTLIIMSMSTHGKEDKGVWHLPLKKLKYYAVETFNIKEIVFVEFVQLLKVNNFLSLELDQDGLPNIVAINNLGVYNSLLLFFNTQRLATDDKKLVISNKCELFLKRILEQVNINELKDGTALVGINNILDDFKENKVPICEEDLQDAIKAGLSDDILVDENGILSVKINHDRLVRIYPSIVLMNAVQGLNESKRGPASRR